MNCLCKVTARVAKWDFVHLCSGQFRTVHQRFLAMRECWDTAFCFTGWSVIADSSGDRPSRQPHGMLPSLGHDPGQRSGVLRLHPRSGGFPEPTRAPGSGLASADRRMLGGWAVSAGTLSGSFRECAAGTGSSERGGPDSGSTTVPSCGANPASGGVGSVDSAPPDQRAIHRWRRPRKRGAGSGAV